MASKQSISKKRAPPLLVIFILTIGEIELKTLSILEGIITKIVRFLIRWILSIICVLCGVGGAYIFFYFLFFLPVPTNLLQYQHSPSLTIYDKSGILLSSEWNTQRTRVSYDEVSPYRSLLPSKEVMSHYLADNSQSIHTDMDKKWFAIKMMYLYSYNSIAATYMNAKVFQRGVVGVSDAAEVYFQRPWKDVGIYALKRLLSTGDSIPQKQLYARMSVETAAIRQYFGKMSKKRTGSIHIYTSLDVHLGVHIAYESLLGISKEQVIIEEGMVRAWTSKNNELLAKRAILKTTEGGEYNE